MHAMRQFKYRVLAGSRGVSGAIVRFWMDLTVSGDALVHQPVADKSMKDESIDYERC